MKTVRLVFTDEQKEFIKKNYQALLYLDIAKALNNYINRTWLRLTADEFERRKSIGKFKKGQASWNAGLSLPNKPNSGQFVRGSLPRNTMYDGAIVLRKRTNRINLDYYFIRIAQGKWKRHHVYLWEQANGPLPKGCIVRFKDKDHLNCTLENLEMIDRRKNMDLNRNYSGDRMRSDKVVSFYITRDPQLRKELEKHPEIIEAKRQQLKLEKLLNEIK